MTESEAHTYLHAQRRIIFVTNGPDGMPHPVPVQYGLDDNGDIFVTSFRKSQKIRNLQRDPRASLLVENDTLYEELRRVADVFAEGGRVVSRQRQ